jgi:hypothetical protein
MAECACSCGLYATIIIGNELWRIEARLILKFIECWIVIINVLEATI